jgi:hypothetical protein
MKHVMRIGVVLVLILFVVASFAPASRAGAESEDVVQLKRIGHPTWKPVDFHLFSAPVGTADSGYTEFGATMLALLPPPNHVANSIFGGVGPGAPHLPPYNTEFAQGVANLGYHQGQRFRAPEFSNGNGVWLTWMTVPNRGTTGSSPDFVSGPIIPNSLFPIHVSGATWRNGAIFNANVVTSDIPPLDASLDPPFNVDGHSHFPFFVADNLDFGPAGTKPQGNYEYRLTMLDQQGNGWSIVIKFTITK